MISGIYQLSFFIFLRCPPLPDACSTIVLSRYLSKLRPKANCYGGEDAATNGKEGGMWEPTFVFQIPAAGFKLFL